MKRSNLVRRCSALCSPEEQEEEEEEEGKGNERKASLMVQLYGRNVSGTAIGMVGMVRMTQQS